jgi:hypothetical protein
VAREFDRLAGVDIPRHQIRIGCLTRITSSASSNTAYLYANYVAVRTLAATFQDRFRSTRSDLSNLVVPGPEPASDVERSVCCKRS